MSTRKIKSQTFGLGVLVLLLIVALLVAIFERLVSDGAVTFFTPSFIEIHTPQVATSTELANVLETVMSPVEAAPIVHNDGVVRYLKVTEGCSFDYSDECLRVRSGPGTDYDVVGKLRTGIVLRTDESETVDGIEWHKVVFDEWLRYPERVGEAWYVSGEYTEIFYDEGEIEYQGHAATGTKKIIVDRGDETLIAYDGEEVFMEAEISTGLELTPTPRGTFFIFRKTPSRYMQGPLPYLVDQQYYDLPGVPWNMYFTDGGAAIHGTYWHNSFGQAQSHGCVNLPPDKAEELYRWAELGTTVVVRD